MSYICSVHTNIHIVAKYVTPLYKMGNIQLVYDTTMRRQFNDKLQSSNNYKCESQLSPYHTGGFTSLPLQVHFSVGCRLALALDLCLGDCGDRLQGV